MRRVNMQEQLYVWIIRQRTIQTESLLRNRHMYIFRMGIPKTDSMMCFI